MESAPTLLDADAALTSDEAQETARLWRQLLAEMAADDPFVQAAIVAKLDRRGADVATHGAIGEQAWSYLRLITSA